MDKNYILIIGLLILLIDILLRLRLMKKELEFARLKYDEEKKLREEQSVAEKNLRMEQEDWLRSEMIKLSEVAKPLAANIKAQLINDVSWLSSALQQANIGSDSNTLFFDRLGHFKDEKKELADKFVPLLIARCKYHIEENKKTVCLIIDSGTTLYDFFEVFAASLAEHSHSQEKWINQIFVATNNLPGVEVAMEKGRINPTDRFSHLAFDCFLFPGKPLSIYAAVTGKETIAAIDRFKEEHMDAIFIGIAVGNWIRIQRTPGICPIPMARGEGHLPFKQKLIDISHEVFVIAPLGKIFLNVTDEDINAALKLDAKSTLPAKEIYVGVNIDDPGKIKKIKLVSTCRPGKKYLLHWHSKDLEDILAGNVNKPFDDIDISTDEIEQVKHILFPFTKLPDIPFFEKETEFPHSITRKPDFMRKFFGVKE